MKEPIKHKSVYLLLRAREAVPVDALVDAAKRGQAISRAEFRDRHDASPADRAAVREHYGRYGLQVLDRPEWRTVELRGSLVQFVFAFPGGPDDPIPEPLADIVEWVWGVHRIGRPEPELPENARGVDPTPDSNPEPADPRALVPRCYDPPEFARLYGFPPELRGEGQCIGVLSLLGGYKHSDLDVFFAALDMPRPRILDVGDNRWATGPGDLWTNYEVTMDLQVASSCAPAATTVVYHSDARCLDEVDTWAYWQVFCRALFDEHNQPCVLTLSAGLAENLPGYWTKPEALLVNDLLAVAACLGVTVCFPTGDSGSNYPTGKMMFDAPALTYFPSSSPWALAVGATTIEVEHGQLVGERVWNRLGAHMNLQYSSAEPPRLPSNLGASTGGTSMYFPMPEWQRKAEVPPYLLIDFTNWVFSNSRVFEGRAVPDVAACGDFLTGYRVYLDGRWCNGGGTSASSPFWAAMIARINQALGRPVGFVTPILYELVLERGVSPFNRPTGNNGAFMADPGKPWDACTGLGTPRGGELIAALREYFLRLSVEREGV
jgi:kumamolisin